jgi:hypothetical protein
MSVRESDQTVDLFDLLRSLSSNATSQLDILGHDRHSLRVDRTQIGVFEKTHQVSLGCLLQGKHGRALETKIGLEVLSDLANKSLERQFANQQLSRLLVSSDLTKSHCSWAVSVGLLHSSSGWGRFSGGFGGQLFSRSLPSGALAGGLLCSGHRFLLFFSLLFLSIDCFKSATQRIFKGQSEHLRTEKRREFARETFSVS